MKKALIASIAFLSPALALAQTAPITDANTLTQKLIDIGNVVIYLLIALAVIYIIWNIVNFMIKGSDDPKRSEARSHVIWGIVGLAIIMSIWGLVNILTNTFKTTAPTTSTPNISNQQVPLVR